MNVISTIAADLIRSALDGGGGFDPWLRAEQEDDRIAENAGAALTADLGSTSGGFHTEEPNP